MVTDGQKNSAAASRVDMDMNSSKERKGMDDDDALFLGFDKNVTVDP